MFGKPSDKMSNDFEFGSDITSLKMYMFGVVGETHTHDYFEVISFYNSKDI